ncbi:hypothetical protein BBK36DRAFT_1141643 [Trichoderma citrinoviride]|uniref:Uncharacterized protein n=1 Tax=Trichoderma citrinoviride TaxID=58853 RepID=A0A2T4B8N8_9HYPO|nr:hypothetical protein BBK36DRAFT_1141643 [Trichoderma citrinoviride]PTB65694.1 hypothetical protein BBK36DRAFT_1141643 [Trichoderma citrinoviride]
MDRQEHRKSDGPSFWRLMGDCEEEERMWVISIQDTTYEFGWREPWSMRNTTDLVPHWSAPLLLVQTPYCSAQGLIKLTSTATTACVHTMLALQKDPVERMVITHSRDRRLMLLRPISPRRPIYYYIHSLTQLIALLSGNNGLSLNYYYTHAIQHSMETEVPARPYRASIFHQPSWRPSRLGSGSVFPFSLTAAAAAREILRAVALLERGLSGSDSWVLFLEV